MKNKSHPLTVHCGFIRQNALCLIGYTTITLCERPEVDHYSSTSSEWIYERAGDLPLAARCERWGWSGRWPRAPPDKWPRFHFQKHFCITSNRFLTARNIQCVQHELVLVCCWVGLGWPSLVTLTAGQVLPWGLRCKWVSYRRGRLQCPPGTIKAADGQP